MVFINYFVTVFPQLLSSSCICLTTISKTGVILKNDKIYDANIKKKALLLHYC